MKDFKDKLQNALISALIAALIAALHIFTTFLTGLQENMPTSAALGSVASAIYYMRMSLRG